MALSFIDKIKAIKMTSFKFVDFEKKLASKSEEDEERMAYLVFTLETPIPEVTSSTSLYDTNSQTRVHDVTYDVEKVSCKVSLIELYESEFKFDEDKDGELLKTGSYNGDMFLDLAKGGAVWLTDEKFSKMGTDYRKSQQANKIKGIMSKYKENGERK